MHSKIVKSLLPNAQAGLALSSVELRLDPDEARWLRAMVQNHLSDQEETPDNYRMRKKFFEALEGVAG